MIPLPSTSPPAPQVSSPPVPSQRDAALRDAAENLEAAFLAEMLQSAGLGKTSESFGGGAGEDQFSSFLIQEQAKQIVGAGGIGLAEALFDALKEQANDT